MPFNTIASDSAGGAGGTCVLRGCVPKKLFVYAAEYREFFSDAQGFGWVAGAGWLACWWWGRLPAPRLGSRTAPAHLARACSAWLVSCAWLEATPPEAVLPHSHAALPAS